MGQYFEPITQSLVTGEVRYWSTNPRNSYKESGEFDFDHHIYIGLKLMEHSYYNNPLTDAISAYLYKNPSRLWWLGDYADEEKTADIPKNPTESPYRYKESVQGNFYSAYVLNHTRRTAFRIEFDPRKNFNIYPISLLTAVGNGNGGGDYYGKYMELVGIWAGEIISIDDEVPSNYTLTEGFQFSEER